MNTNRLCKFVLVCIFMLSGYAHAQTLYVNSSLATGTNDGSSWDNAYQGSGALGTALITAKSRNEDGDPLNNITQVWVAKGTYLPVADVNGNLNPASNRLKTFKMLNNVVIYGGFADNLTGTSGSVLARTDIHGINETIMSGDLGTLNDDTDNSYHVINNLYTIGAPLTSTGGLDGFSVEFGHADLGTDADANGAGMYNQYASPTIKNVIFRKNKAKTWGGGIYNIHSSSPSFELVTIENNETVTSGGGGMVSTSSSSPVILNSIIRNNKAETTGGGLHYTSTAGTTSTIQGTTITGNTAKGSGGGIYNEQVLVITSSNITLNTASTGGAIAVVTPSVVTFTTGKIQGNKTTSTGGGIFITGGSFTAKNALITGNTATAGAGIFSNSGGHLYLTHVTIAGNYQPSGGAAGIQGWSTLSTLRNSVVGRNFVGSSEGNVSISPTAGYATYNLVNGYTNAVDNNINSEAYFMNPILVQSATDNTTAGDYRLRGYSDGINAGDNSQATGALISDIDGNARPYVTAPVSNVDMGAYEFQGLPAGPDVFGILYVKKNGAGLMTGRDWANALPELSEALRLRHFERHAVKIADVGQIWVAEGKYLPTYNSSMVVVANADRTFVMQDNLGIYGGFAGTEQPSSLGDATAKRNARAIVSNLETATSVTILSGDMNGDDGANWTNRSDNVHRVFTNNAITLSSAAVLDGFTISGGGPTIPSGSYPGGGMYNNGASALPTLRNLIFRSNRATTGGGIHIANSAPLITKSAFIENAATAASDGGGGIYLAAAHITMSDIIVRGNTSVYWGGGIRNAGSNVILERVIIESNTAGTHGGGLFNADGGQGSARISNGIIRNNTATQNGGAIYVHNQNPNFRNVAIYGNHANGVGGVIGTISPAVPRLMNATIFNNTAGTPSTGVIGGTGASPIISNSIVWGNGAEVFNSNASTSYSIVDGNRALGSNNLSADPVFISTNSADPDFLHLGAGSPAMNAGSNDVYTNTIVNPNFFGNLSTDVALNGTFRNYDNLIDIGANERPRKYPRAAVNDADNVTFTSNKYRVVFGTNIFKPAKLTDSEVPSSSTLPSSHTYELVNPDNAVVTIEPGDATLSMLKAGEQVLKVKTPATDLLNTPGGYDAYEQNVTLNVVAGPAVKIAITGPSTVVAGATSTNFTVTAYDVNDQIANVAANTVFTLSSEESSTSTFTPVSGVFQILAGQSSATFTYRNTKVGDGTHTIMANRSSGDALGSATRDITVNAGAFAKLQLLVPGESAAPGTSTGKTGTPSSRTAGSSFNVTVNAVDADWNVVSSAPAHTIAVTSNDGNATLPSNAALASGSQTFSVTLKTAGTTSTLTATNSTDNTKTSNTSPNITVTAGAVAKLQLLMPGETAAPGTSTGKTGTPSAQSAGSAVTVRVNAVDADWNVVSSATPTVAITSGDANATLPSNASLTAGTRTFNITFKTAGTQTVTSTDNAATLTASTGANTTINAGTFAKLQLLVPGETAAPGTSTGKTGTPSSRTAGSSFNVTVNAVDADWNVVSSVPAHTIAITSNDANATLPSNAALASGSQTFSVTLKTAGTTSTLTATNSTDNTKTSNTSPNITVNVGAVAKLQLLMPGETAAPGTSTGKTGTPSAQSAGSAVTVRVNAVDADWNVVSSATPMVAITSGDANATLPSNAALTAGTGTFNITFKTAGTQTATATDNAATLTASTGANTTINAGAVAASGTSASVPNGTAGSATTISVTAKDANGNPVGIGGATVSASITGANTATITATDNNDGTYTIIYTPLLSGSDNVVITLNTSPINGSPFSSSVGTGVAVAGQSTLTPSSANIIADGVAIQVLTVQAKDANGNNLTIGGASVTITRTSGTGAVGVVTDNNNGTYTATVTSPVAIGSGVFAATLNSSAIPGSSTLTYIPGAVAASATTAVVPGGTAGALTTIVVTAKDANGNLVDVGGATVNVTVSGANTTTPSVTDNGDGTYTVVYTPVTSGADQVAITIGGTAISGSPYSSVVSHGDGDATKTTASLSPGKAGATTTTTISVKDANGNPVPGITLSNLAVTIGGANSGVTVSALTDNGDGTYTITYVPTKVGTDQVDIKLNGAAISGSPYSSVVSPGAGDATKATASLSPGKAGATTTTTISVKDANGNPVSGITLSNLAVTIAGANAGVTVSALTDNGDGTYTVTYVPTKAGTDQIDIKLNGTAISGSPYSSVVGPGASDATETTASLSPGKAGVTTTTTISVKDGNGNPVPGITLSNLAVTIGGANAGATVSALTDNGDGTYTVTYVPTKAGTDQVNIKLNGTAISGSPYSSVVSPGAGDATKTTASSSPGKAGATTTTTISVKDANGNPVPGITLSNLAVTIGGVNAGATVSALTDNGDGTYTVTYVPGVSGTDQIDIRLNGIAISGSPYNAIVAVGAALAGPPLNIISVAGNRQVSLSWLAPLNNGGGVISDYIVQYTVDNGTNWITFNDGLSANLQTQVTGLANNRMYHFRVAAVNVAGTGSYVTTGTAVIPTEPVPDNSGQLPRPEPGQTVVIVNGQPETVTLEVVDNSSIRLSSSNNNFAINLTSISIGGQMVPVSDIDATIKLIRGIGNTVKVTGYGFEPGTVVTMYLFSQPLLLGYIPVQSDGRFEGVLSLPADIELGRHTLQANGLVMNALVERSISVGVLVEEPSIIPKPIVKITDPAPVCEPAKIDLTTGAITAGSDAGLRFVYYLDQNGTQDVPNPSAVSQSGTYYIAGINSFGSSSAIMPVTIIINPLPVAAIVSDMGTQIARGDVAKLAASGGVSYVWADDKGIINGETSSVLTIRPAVSTTYTVTAFNAAGCSSSGSITVHVVQDHRKVVANNLISPNGDGINDTWTIANIDLYPDNQVKIFDKAGRLLYQKKAYNNEWDGTWNGNPLAEGTYYYIIDFGHASLLRKGFITIVRNDQ